MTPSSMIAIKVIPSASRLVHSLRDLGYDFPKAVADVIDNSIAAGATLIGIDLRFDGQESWLRVSDNGSGMDGRRRDGSDAVRREAVLTKRTHSASSDWA